MRLARAVVTTLALMSPALGSSAARADTCSSITITSVAPSRAEVQTEQACSGCDAGGVSRITFTFDRAYTCGEFVDGQPWVLDEGGGVVVTDIQPPVTSDCGGTVCNGWMVDPASGGQAFDDRRSYDAAGAPTPLNPSPGAPYTAVGPTSLVKAVSLQDEIVGDACDDTVGFGVSTRQCLYYVGVLTVLDQAPANGTGAEYFRPPYVAGDKPSIPVDQANLGWLPALPTSQLGQNPPDLARATGYLCSPAISFMGTYSNQFFKGFLNSGEHPSGYQGHVSRSEGDRLLRILFADRDDRAAYCAIQRGIDMVHMLHPPVAVSWNPNGGHGQGRTAWPYLAAALLGRDDWRARMDAMSPGRFAERSQVYYSPVADPDGEHGGAPGEVLYGAYPGAGGTAQCVVDYYWYDCMLPDWPGSGCNRVCADPFNFIDGGHPGTSYQAIFTPAAKAHALAARLVPALGRAWPEDDGHKLFLDYMDRWVDHGAWALPDPCGRDAVQPDPGSPDSCAGLPAGSCVCNPGAPRYPELHGTNADGGTSYRSAWAGHVWDAFRACASDCSCPGMDGLCDEPDRLSPAAPANLTVE